MQETTEKEQSEVISPDTKNATYFHPEESNRQAHFERLRSYNRGTWKDRREENKEVTHRIDNLAIFDALSGQLDLTDYQTQEARCFFDNLELGQLGKPTRLVAFGVCAVVANEDVPDGTRYHPSHVDPDPYFQRVVDDLEFSESQLHSIIGQIRARRRQ